MSERFGVTTWPGWYDTSEERRSFVEKMMQSVKMLNAKWIRIELKWSLLEKTEKKVYDEFAFTIFMDNILQVAEALHISILPTIWSTPPWAAPAKQKPPKDISDWSDFITYVVNRYKDKIKFWQFWNEPTYPDYWKGTDEEFVELTKAGYQAAKAIDPTCKIVLGGSAAFPCAHLEDVHSLKALYEAGVKDWFDILALHLYTGSASPDIGADWCPGGIAAMVKNVRGYIESHVDYGREIWCTEFGYKTSEVGLENQAAYTVLACNLMKENDIAKMFYFDFWDEQFDWSLVSDLSLTPKPVYGALREYLTRL